MQNNFTHTTRLMLALSLDGYLPASLSKVHEKYATPYIGIIVAFVVGELSLVLFVIGVLSVITLLWAGVVMFAIMGVAAMLYPSRMRDVWSGNGGGTLLGIPTIRIWGALLVPAMLVVLYILWNDPNVGIGQSAKQMWLYLGLPVSWLLAGAAIWAV